MKSKKSMGVINLTPDSFSLSSQSNDLQSFEAAFEKMCGWADIIDIGAESTAPFNKPVSQDLEISRYRDIFFPFIEKNIDPKMTISIDTYKVDVFKEVAQKINMHWPECSLIFNDVSGKIDEELIELIKNSIIKFRYIFSHNLAPSRAKTNEHMKYISNNDGISFVKELVEYFVSGIEKLSSYNVDFLIDPCFGFSKTREQNQYLLKNFNIFILQIPKNIDCVYGISRKSFLRFPKDLDVNNLSNIAVLDQTQSYFISEVLKKHAKRKFLFRVHSPESLQAARVVASLFN